MARLTVDEVRSIWADMTMCWDKQNHFNEETYSANVGRVAASSTYGLHTTGSTGNFYAMDYAEFRRMADIQAEVC